MHSVSIVYKLARQFLAWWPWPFGVLEALHGHAPNSISSWVLPEPHTYMVMPIPWNGEQSGSCDLCAAG